MASKGRILQLQNYSVNDGDGIRTVIFFAGCPLRCKWCANPEGYTTKNKILYIASRCTVCQRCTTACPQHISYNFSQSNERMICTGCGNCVTACLDGARENTVKTYTVEEILQKLESQLLFFRQSGGGVTYSGGECTSQPDFLNALSAEVYDMGLHQAAETSGYFRLADVLPTIERLDLLFMDIKHMDNEQHILWTGRENEPILRNIVALGARKKNLVIRVPTIMGVNGDDENIRKTARFVKQYLQKPMMELLPYHCYGIDKYMQLGIAYEDFRFRTPTVEELRHLKGIIEDEGVQVVSFA